MAINPISYTENVTRSFLRYQLTAYPFADAGLNEQMRTLLSLESARNSPLVKGPFISLSRSFQQGSSVDQLIADGVFHPLMRQRIPSEISHVYGHQDRAIRAITSGHTTLVSTGTGSGKTECFLYPIISKCFQLRDIGAEAGISAVIVYPMNALAEDQLGRLRQLLAGTGITFGMYVGKTPETEAEVTGIRMPANSTREAYLAKLEKVQKEGRGETVHPAEEVCSREMMRRGGRQPRILLTNVKQLELLLTRQRDVELFADARLDFLVFDEAHTFTGANGAETALLIRRLRSFCGRDAHQTVCVATSATIVDKDNPNAARDFASRFFGVADEEIVTVNEDYEVDTWHDDAIVPPAPQHPQNALEQCVAAVDDHYDTEAAVGRAYQSFAGRSLPTGQWEQALYDELSRNRVLHAVADELRKPRTLSDLPEVLTQEVGRPVTEEEILALLTLGAAARNEERPLVRPVVHMFVRGISGAVVSFPPGQKQPQLWLSAEDEIAQNDESGFARYPVSTCTTCGQHYFATSLGDFSFVEKLKQPNGGIASGNSWYWSVVPETDGGTRVLVVNSLISQPDDDLHDEDKLHPLYFCRTCGSAHPENADSCMQCGTNDELVQLFVVRQKEDNIGHLNSCVSCGANGRKLGSRYREPARPVRATQVSDVHVLAQDMLQHAERKRLLIFSDNRQDAAFQAGWMRDHARRFRLRAMMAECLEDGGSSVGDIARYMSDKLEADETLSRLLIPEVWQRSRREGSGGKHEVERLKFLRIQVLREVAMSTRQPLGLEPWGRMKVDYQGLNATLAYVRETANRLRIPQEEMRDGIATILDYFRRKRILWDAENKLFSKYWQDGDYEIQYGYFSNVGGPKGTKFRREGDDQDKYVTQWISDRGDTTLRQIARKWGVESDQMEEFLQSLFDFLTDSSRKFLVPVTLRGAKEKPLSGVSGVYQVNADVLRMYAHHGVYRCNTCRRRTPRRTPFNKCTAWRCDGTLEFLGEDADNYNLQLLDGRYELLRPAEHTAMIPHEERELIENHFRGASDRVNTLVCTPTLELGVDIGQLDMVLMRNVPPLPANYWQRAGRAGRRHRMAVDVTYCRAMSHDRAYFQDPLKLLLGRVDPPAFNLRNELMVSKHIHATVITRLNQYAEDSTRADAEQVREVLDRTLPSKISDYLFDARGHVRQELFDLADLEALIQRNEDDLLSYISGIFAQGWPKQDASVVTLEEIRRHIVSFVPELRQVIQRLRRRLQWAMMQQARLGELRVTKGTLDSEDEDLFRRCDRLIKKLKGTAKYRRSNAEGVDDIVTFSVLAAEGFLPGYGLETGSIVANASMPSWQERNQDLSLPRPPSVALREFVPGNLIYTNGNRYVARRFRPEVSEEHADIPLFEISTERMAVTQIDPSANSSSLGSSSLLAMPVCDVELVHQSTISDEDETRFQIGVAVYGMELKQHNGGKAYMWGGQPLHHRRNVNFRLVNVGVNSNIQKSPPEFGYPICQSCGQSVSPLSSSTQLKDFRTRHEQCRDQPVQNIGLYADVTADSITLPNLADQKIAFSVLEAIRIAATHVLDMHMEDLQILVIGHGDRDEVDAVLWDPMPGGSGLLDQVLERFSEIHAAALEVVEHCPSACATSCIDCLQTFRNGFYHKKLDRHAASAMLHGWEATVASAHDIPVLHPIPAQQSKEQPVNNAERLFQKLVRRAGLPDGIWGQQIKLGNALGTTTPDVIFRAEEDADDEGLVVYIDGLSINLHGDPARSQKDKEIRSWLENHKYEVIQISVHELTDETAMARHFKRIANHLGDRQLGKQIYNDRGWFGE